MPDNSDNGFEEKPVKPHYAGHRNRLRERFRSAGPDTIPDYELLELLLFRALPQRDTKPIAKDLINSFGNMAEVLHAEPERLKETSGVGESVVTELKLVREIALRLAQSEVHERPVFNSMKAIITYCTMAMAYNSKEQFRILFLDKKNILIKDEVQQTGTIDHTPVYPREVVKRALELSAAAIILVHNHPSGDPTPSRADIDMTKKIIHAASSLNIVVHDHIIIGRSGAASFRELGLI